MSLLDAQRDAVRQTMPFRIVGTVTGISGLTIEAAQLPLPIGALCRIHSFGHQTATAEVVGFAQDKTLLMPLSPVSGVARGDRIENITAAPRIWCSDQLLGRVLNGFGQPADGRGPLVFSESRRIDNKAVAPLDRTNIREPISTGLRAIDALHTCGLGQRMGIFSGPGVGKSTLMSSIAKYTSADVSVIALIGERGREVQEFLENALGEAGLKRSVVIVSTGDEPPLLRVRAAKVACAVAEYFRDRGLHVMLMMDSITRLCQAQRQIGLAAREPPATKGFPPSVFALLPEILERAGRTAAGSITGFYTVLVEGDDFNEPIPDAVKGITDGHLWLNRALANRGHFPAIDMLQSISRVRGDVTSRDQAAQVRRVLRQLALYAEIEDLVNIRAYVEGNIEYDTAIKSRERILQFLQQDAATASTMDETKKQLADLVTWIDQVEKTLRAQQAQAQAQQQRTRR
ncbi:MAG TPA: FliI/YscN family ATPase [Tepidisphaeraceae bacterium]|jgi:FliI/YscN family ATPase